MPKIQNWTSAKLGDSPNDLIWIGSNSCNFSCSTPVIVSLEHRKQQRSKKQFQNVTDDLSFIKSNHPQYFRTLFGVGKITEWITKGKAQNTFDFFAIPRWFIFFYFFGVDTITKLAGVYQLCWMNSPKFGDDHPKKYITFHMCIFHIFFPILHPKWYFLITKIPGGSAISVVFLLLGDSMDWFFWEKIQENSIEKMGKSMVSG